MVVLKNGERHLDRFVERKGKFMIFENLGRLGVHEVKKFILYKKA